MKMFLPATSLRLKLCFAFLFILAFKPALVHSQSQTDYHNTQLRQMFQSVTFPFPDRDYFYDLAVHSLDTANHSVHFDSIANDTMQANMWAIQYEEV